MSRGACHWEQQYMKTLWLTYAWKDNQQADIDHIIGRLRSPDMSVNFNRARSQSSGRRLQVAAPARQEYGRLN